MATCDDTPDAAYRSAAKIMALEAEVQSRRGSMERMREYIAELKSEIVRLGGDPANALHREAVDGPRD